MLTSDSADACINVMYLGVYIEPIGISQQSNAMDCKDEQQMWRSSCAGQTTKVLFR